MKRQSLYSSNNFKFINLINNQQILNKFDDIISYIKRETMDIKKNLKELFDKIREKNVKVSKKILNILEIENIEKLENKSPSYIKNLLISPIQSSALKIKERISKDYYLYNDIDTIVYNKIQHDIKSIRDKVKNMLKFLKTITEDINDKELINKINKFYEDLLEELKKLDELLVQNQKNNKEKINNFRQKRKELKI
jgi:hypothetical protein